MYTQASLQATTGDVLMYTFKQRIFGSERRIQTKTMNRSGLTQANTIYWYDSRYPVYATIYASKTLPDYAPGDIT